MKEEKDVEVNDIGSVGEVWHKVSRYTFRNN